LAGKFLNFTQLRVIWGEAGHAQGDITLLAQYAAFSFYFLGSTPHIPSSFFCTGR